jgi:regulator of cell morphogenesis and NO signaling
MTRIIRTGLSVTVDLTFIQTLMTTVSASEIEKFTVADVALNYPHAIRILNRCGLDYCCNGKTPFIEACEKRNLNPYIIWQQIQDEIQMVGRNQRREFRNWETNLLIDFILQHHHEYLRLTIPQIRNLLQTVCKIHDDKPELLDVQHHFDALASDLLGYLPSEEDVLFPALRRLSRPVPPESPIIDGVQKTISAMEQKYGRIGEIIRCIRQLTNDYTIPSHACPTFQLLFKLLEEFEYDVMQHIHLENNILFPKATYAYKNKIQTI